MTRRQYLLLLFGLILIALAFYFFVPQRQNGESFVRLQPPDPGQAERGGVQSMDFFELQVTVSMDEMEFFRLQQATRAFQADFPHIYVVLSNHDPSSNSDASGFYQAYRQAARLGEAADVVLLENRWIQEFARTGYLKPVDAVLSGDALADQWRAFMAPMKWNGYVWGVPKDADPWIPVWSRTLLAVADQQQPPAGWNAYEELVERLRQSEQAFAELSLADDRADGWVIWYNALNNNENEEESAAAVNLLTDGEQRLQRFTASEGEAVIAQQLVKGELLSAVLPWSVLQQQAPELLEQLIVVWSDNYKEEALYGRSYAISSGTANEEAAREWIKAMTGVDQQERDWQLSGRLPARKSLYTSTTLPQELLAWLQQKEEKPLQRVDAGGVPEEELNLLWRRMQEGELPPERFVERWQQLDSSAD